MFGFRLLKKGLCLFLVALIVGAVFLGGEVWSYVRTSRSAMASAVKNQIPIEFEIKRAKEMIDQIIPEIHANMKLIAEEEVEIEDLERDVAKTVQRLQKEKQGITVLNGALAEAKGQVEVAGRTYAQAEVRQDLARRFERYKSGELLLAGKKKLLATRKKSLGTAIDELKRAQSAKTALEDQAHALSARLRVIQAAQATSGLQVDHSKLAKAEKLLAEIQKRLDIAQRVLENEAKLTDGIPVAAESSKDISARVREYFEERDAG